MMTASNIVSMNVRQPVPFLALSTEKELAATVSQVYSKNSIRTKAELRLAIHKYSAKEAQGLK